MEIYFEKTDKMKTRWDYVASRGREEDVQYSKH